MGYGAILSPSLKTNCLVCSIQDHLSWSGRSEGTFFFMCQKVLVASEMPLQIVAIRTKYFLWAVWSV